MKLTKRQLAWLLVHGRNEIQRIFNIIEEEKGKQHYLTTEAEYKTIVGR